MIYQVLQETGLPVAYSHFENPPEPPFLVYRGVGQDQFDADNQIYVKKNNYTVEYYFTAKNTAAENAIEDLFQANGYFYTKGEDTYIESENLFVIYYDVTMGGFYQL